LSSPENSTALDVNILAALMWPTHEHHDVAHRWFDGRADAAWATCSLTQLGFVRVMSNPAFSRDALTPTEGLALLGKGVSHPAHEFWTDSLSIGVALKGMETRVQGHKQVNDAYLLALAHKRKGVLATFGRPCARSPATSLCRYSERRTVPADNEDIHWTGGLPHPWLHGIPGSYSGMKIALSIPDDLFEEADTLSKRLGVSRSRLYATALADYVAKHRGRKTTERLNAVYQEDSGRLDPVLRRTQRRSLGSDTW
jgi:uncharacterized protein